MSNNAIHTPPLPPPGALFSDQMASAVMAAIEKLDEALQHEVLRLLRDRLHHPEARSGTEARILARGVAALREAAELLFDAADDAGLAHPPHLSERAYARLRAENPHRGWPPESNIRRNLGTSSWHNALRRAHLDPTDDEEVNRREQGIAYEWQDIEAAILACQKDMRAAGIVDPNPGWDAYMAWARRAEVEHRDGRRPRSMSAFQRYGGWSACKLAALAGNGPPTREQIERVRETSAKARRPRKPYVAGDCAAALRKVRDELGRSPTTSDYAYTRERIHARAVAAGSSEVLPSLTKLFQHFGSWDAALVAAGLTPFHPPRLDKEGRPARVQPGRRIVVSDEEILAALRAAYEAKGKPFSINAYKDWRLEQDCVDASGQRLPSYPCIHKRFRGVPRPWKAACNKALAPGWDAK